MFKERYIQRNAQWLGSYTSDELKSLDMKKIMAIVEASRELDYTHMSKGLDILLQTADDKIIFNRSNIMKLGARIGLKQSWAIAKRFRKMYEAIIENDNRLMGKVWRTAAASVHPDRIQNDPHAEAISKLVNADKEDLCPLLESQSTNYALLKSMTSDDPNYEYQRLDCLLAKEIYVSYMSKEEYTATLNEFAESTTLPKAEYESDIRHAIEMLEFAYD